MQQWMKSYLEKLMNGLYIPSLSVTDIMEILIIAVVVYGFSL